METGGSERIWAALQATLTEEWLRGELENFTRQFAHLKALVDPARTSVYSRGALVDLFESLRKTLGEIYPYSNAFYVLSSEIEKNVLEKLSSAYGEERANEILAQSSRPSPSTSLVTYWERVRFLADRIAGTHGKVKEKDVADLCENHDDLRDELETIRNDYFCLTALNAEERTVASILPDIVSVMETPMHVAAPARPPEVEKDLSLLRTMIYFKDEISTFIIPYVFHGLKKQWDATAALLAITPKDLEQLLMEEVIGALKHPTELTELVEKRKRATLFFHAPFKSTEVIEGTEASDVIASLASQNQTTDYSTVTEIKGKAGAPGTVTGIVHKIMHSNDIQNFKEGHILVTVYTAPEFVPAMKKARAIVTDTGGITCHAAIVSRELHKPCVVGTKIATEVLKDGDEVEVDADKGIVTILHNE
ncbi:hypothetical protein HY416_03795 [Candidatus Kaiserbacteria bacterium]|nr:hypothetical protein [Candidatus Kaiserbacteria bacterium]